ncbi:hypothetical protein Ahy_A04g020745 [Arachis hypogaea]|uniref:Transposase MuDR plant domain-containing protein n=1 Tax=Arachis hypogaea TaxID=3818 RepID=A0A445DIH0_ARAHY|nr:hypothetical protein Ahy_A04g020745 [Arachis hypogaea]
MRAMCKDESCGWLVYASNNTKNNCWQIKTFVDLNTKKNCEKRAADEEEVVVVEAIAANGGEGQLNNFAPVEPVNNGEATPVLQPHTEIQLEFSQPPLSETDDS